MMDRAFITVKYGDNEEAIFNPWCSSYTLLEWIRKKCNCEDDITIDLVDQEGQVKNLAGRSREYASDVVIGRETYILIRVEKQGENGPYHYTSLLNNLEDINPDLMVKLNSLSRPHTRNKSRGSKSSKNSKSLKTPRQESPSKRPLSSERRKSNK